MVQRGEGESFSMCVHHTRHHLLLVTQRIQMESVSLVEMSSEHSVDIKLSASPKLLMEMSDVRVKNGEMAEFNCSFNGQPFTGVVWDHNGQSLADTERVRRSQSGGLFSLVIQSVGVVDQGVYRCTATNQHGQNSSSAQLTSVSSGPSHLSTATSCFDAPNVSFKWFKDGQSIREGDKYRIISRFSTSSLELLAPTKEDSGEYTCKASNQHGSDECSASLSVTGKSDACFFPLRWLSLGLLLVL
uniref:Ig-like domain-containing protein n=1 Tax=Seriola dumerili TaxID=41447 RepID=A0A3B4TIA1_SERDU